MNARTTLGTLLTAAVAGTGAAHAQTAPTNGIDLYFKNVTGEQAVRVADVLGTAPEGEFTRTVVDDTADAPLALDGFVSLVGGDEASGAQVYRLADATYATIGASAMREAYTLDAANATSEHKNFFASDLYRLPTDLANALDSGRTVSTQAIGATREDAIEALLNGLLSERSVNAHQGLDDRYEQTGHGVSVLTQTYEETHSSGVAAFRPASDILVRPLTLNGETIGYASSGSFELYDAPPN